ncbi:trypco2 family protein [Streptomyces bungoensis]|uniref:trypco2 family protein n=1 Tax=Streptomyces bungoensis TaxID=285568 RepID=UPI00341EAE56
MADRHDAPANGQLGLADMVTGLRMELEEAQRRAVGQQLRFTIDDVEVEATVAITRDVNAKGGVQFWVLQAGGEYTHGDATTHRIKLGLRVPPTTLIGDEAEGVE